MKQETPYPLRMPGELRKKLEAEAQAVGRSLHQHILMVLQAAVDNSEETPVTKPELEQLNARVEALEKAVTAIQRQK